MIQYLFRVCDGEYPLNVSFQFGFFASDLVRRLAALAIVYSNTVVLEYIILGGLAL